MQRAPGRHYISWLLAPQVSIYLADRNNPAYGTVRVIVTDQVRAGQQLVGPSHCRCRCCPICSTPATAAPACTLPLAPSNLRDRMTGTAC